MSVPKRKRGVSKMQFVDTARELEAHALSVCARAPKRYTPFLTKGIMELASEVHNHVRAANNIVPANQHEAQMRRDHLIEGNNALQNLDPKLQLLYDFRHYYEMAEHRVLLQESMRRILSRKVRDAADQAVKDFGDRGLGLGSPVSQINALILANGVDHWAKERAGIRWYHRYADDGVAIAKDRRTLELAVAELKNVCAARGITLNEKKTKILPLSRGFRYLKLKFTLDEKGRVHTKVPRRPTKVLRKKLRCFLRWIREGSATMEDLRCVYGSYRGYLTRGEHYQTARRTAAYFRKLYGFWPETKGEWEKYVPIRNGDWRGCHSNCAGVGAEAGERLPEPV